MLESGEKQVTRINSANPKQLSKLLRRIENKSLPPPNEKGIKLQERAISIASELPKLQRNTLSVMIPARRASHLLRSTVPELFTQINYACSKGDILGADVFIILNRGGDDSDKSFAHEYIPSDNVEKIEVWEKQGVMYSDIKYMDVITLNHHSQDAKQNRIIFVHQEDIPENSGHTNALKTGWNLMCDVAKQDSYTSKYYLSTDADIRLVSKGNKSEGKFGLPDLIDEVRNRNLFAVGGKVVPVVLDDTGQIILDKKVSPLIQATANLHTTTKGFQWGPGGGTLCVGPEGLAAQAAVANTNMQVPDVSFWILSKYLLNKDVDVLPTVNVLDSAPAEERLNREQIAVANTELKKWVKNKQTLAELSQIQEIPDSWKKIVRWMMGQKYVKDFFGDEFVKEIAYPKLIQIVVGNIKAVWDQYGFGKGTVPELLRLTKQLFPYVLISSTVNKVELTEDVTW